MKFPIALAAVVSITITVPVHAKTYDLTIGKTQLSLSGKTRTAMTINGGVPGPTLRWVEGETVTLRVKNTLDKDTSIHWHGLILPYRMDGVPKLSFKGIKPGETFTYTFKVRQNGTYWYHSHSGLQEQSGVYGSIVIKPAKRDVVRYDREHVVVLSDWTDEDPHRVLANLKRRSDYYNQSKPTLMSFIRRLRNSKSSEERRGIWKERLAWGQMRMDPSDIADVSGMTYTFLMNGKRSKLNWTALYKPGERVRLRFINASAMTYFDVKIPGLKMTVVQSDGQDVRAVKVDEFRIAIAETYDVIVTPRGRAHTIFARSMDRSGSVRGTLAPRRGMSAAIPPLGKPIKLKMSEMGPAAHGGGSHSGHGAMKPGGAKATGDSAHKGHGAMKAKSMKATGMKAAGHGAHKGHGAMKAKSMKSTGMKAAGHGAHKGHGAMKAKSMKATGMKAAGHGAHKGHGAMKTSSMRTKATGAHKGHGAAMGTSSGMKMGRHAVGSASQLTRNAGRSANGRYKKLTYGDLRGVVPNTDLRKPGRTIVLRLTGNMEAYFWSINDVKYSDAKPIKLKFGERVRIRFVNETMMAHPMHLHGMWSELRNGNGRYNPKKHTISVGPGQSIDIDVTADALGKWAFHCHLLLHMETGMFRKVVVANVSAAN